MIETYKSTNNIKQIDEALRGLSRFTHYKHVSPSALPQFLQSEI